MGNRSDQKSAARNLTVHNIVLTENTGPPPSKKNKRENNRQTNICMSSSAHLSTGKKLTVDKCNGLFLVLMKKIPGRRKQPGRYKSVGEKTAQGKKCPRFTFTRRVVGFRHCNKTIKKNLLENPQDKFQKLVCYELLQIRVNLQTIL